MSNPDLSSSVIRAPGYSPEADSGERPLEIFNTYSFSVVETILRQKTLLNNAIPGFFPYRNSQIGLVEISPMELRPCALYALSTQLEILSDLRKAFGDLGIDPLNFDYKTALVSYSWSVDTQRRICPPIIEVSQDDGNTPIIVDGLYRVIIARQAGLEKIKVIMISNSAIPLPVLAVGWEEVDFCRETPIYEKKRKFRFSTMEENLLWLLQNKERFKGGFESEEKFHLFWKHYFYRSLI